MKKTVILTALIIFIGNSGISQSFRRESQAISMDVGFWNTAYLGNDNYSGFFPSFSASYEHGLKEIPMGSRLTGVISIGGMIGVSFTNYSGTYSGGSYLRSDILIGILRSNYHFIFHDKFDTYTGWWVGYDKRDYKWKGPGTAPEEVEFSPGSIYGGVYIGARWFFNDHIAVYSELGWLLSVVNVGVTLKF